MTGERIRVALIDDSVPVRAALREILEDDGEFEIVGEASNGLDGLELIASQQPEAAVLDLAMPGLDGLDALPRIRDVAPEVKVIVLSLAGRSMQAEALEQGADAYFGKNEPIEYVVVALKSLFGRS